MEEKLYILDIIQINNSGVFWLHCTKRVGLNWIDYEKNINEKRLSTSGKRASPKYH